MHVRTTHVSIQRLRQQFGLHLSHVQLLSLLLRDF